MLDSLRKHATGWIAYFFIGLLVISFAIWGVSDIFTGFGSNTVATVGKTEISTQEFAREYDQGMRLLGQQTGRPVTAAQAEMFGLPGQVLGRLVTQATLDDVARQYGVGISNEMLARKIAEDPNFRGPDGSFSRMNFTQVLRNAGYTEDGYVQDRHKVMLRYQVSDALAGGIAAPEPYLRALHEYRNEARDIRYVVLGDAIAGTVPAPTDTELNAFFEETKSGWRAPEYRALSYFSVLPADLAKPDEVTDEQARATYDADIAEYTTPERREVSQMYFDTRAQADQAAKEISEGKTFEQIALERNLTDSDTELGNVTRDDIIDEKIAEAVFALQPNTTSGVIESNFGFIIARVGAVQPGSVKPFEEVRDAIKQESATELATREMVQRYDEVEDMRAGGETLAEIATKLGVQLVRVEAVDRRGNGQDGNKIADLPGGEALLAPAFETDVGIENDAVRITGNGYVWYEVTAVTAERDRTLDEVRDQVVTAWTRAETNKRIAAKAEEIRGNVAGGQTLDAVAAPLSLEVKQASGLTRTATPPSGLAAVAVSASFGGPTGHVAVADGSADGSKAVLVVQNARVPAFDPASTDQTQIREQVSNQLANDYLQQFLLETQDQIGFSVNQAVLQSVIGQTQRSF